MESRLAAHSLWQGDTWGLIFATDVGTPLNGGAMTKILQRRLVAAGLPRQRFHDLRHASASFQLAQGIPMKVVQEVLGHASYTLTANTYSHVEEAMTKEATESGSERDLGLALISWLSTWLSKAACARPWEIFSEGLPVVEAVNTEDLMVPGAGIEPTRPEGQRILSPPRLPISPSRHASKPQ